MGREIKRVPLDFDFPVGQSWPDAHYPCCETWEDCECVMPEPQEGEGWQPWQTVSDVARYRVDVRRELGGDDGCRGTVVDQRGQL